MKYKILKSQSLGDQIIEVRLDAGFKKGDVVTIDPLYGQQYLYLGDNKFELVSNDKKEEPNVRILPGQDFIKIGHAVKEFSEHIININIAKPRIKAIYRKNLKMSEGKVAAQVAHAVKNIGHTPFDINIVVLKVSDKKFNELIKENPNCYIQVDKGLTEVEPDTPTAAAWLENI